MLQDAAARRGEDKTEIALRATQFPMPQGIEHHRPRRDVAEPGLGLGLADLVVGVGALADADEPGLEVDILPAVDGYPGGADGESDPVDLAIQHTATFQSRRKIYMVSTPTLKGYSRIEAAFAESDQRYFHVPCLACGDMAPIIWTRIRWPEGRRANAWLVCEACGGIHHEHDKARLMEAGEWRATQPGDGRTAGFHLCALYSPWETWAKIAIEHGRVMKDPPGLQVWVNTKLGESWNATRPSTPSSTPTPPCTG